MASTYGLGAAGLAGVGLDQKNEAMKVLANSADEENRRNIANEQIEQQRKAGNQQLGTTAGALAGAALGAQYGSVGGPWGMAIGAVVGGLASSLF